MNGGDLNQQQQMQHQQQQQQHQQQQWAAMQQYQQQQWMAMHYPAMAMQQQMMYQQHYLPYYQQQQQQQQQQQYQQQQPKQNHQIQSSGEDNRTIWIGDLQQWMDDGYLQSCFSQTGEVASVKIIRNKQTGQSERYGFVEFNSHAAAEKVLQNYNGTTMPNTEQPFRLNWAGFSTGDRRPDSGSDLSIFVGDLSADVTDAMLHDAFAARYSSVRGAKVVVDPNTGRSKGYGFVRFGDENERSQAMTEMNGVYCSSRPMRVGVATPKKPSLQQQFSSQAVVLAGGFAPNGAVPQVQSDSDSSNTTIFVGGLDSDVTDEELRQHFAPFGDVLSVKIPAGKGCGFVQFANRSNAEDAIQRLSGTVIGKQTVRLSWGRNLGNKQMRSDYNNQWNNGSYYGKQGYNGYGYSANSGYGASSNGHVNHQQPVS
ncbi:polyadenylate-binding protein RBP47-like isoform X2 [Primulina eburnea]|uniref:polyadenylate-binding protein RBP47-like isoform X2 n=1 Tax=Primulina eburnea TaxID=1245227 RepID=UPI003C6C99C8